MYSVNTTPKLIEQLYGRTLSELESELESEFGVGVGELTIMQQYSNSLRHTHPWDDFGIVGSPPRPGLPGKNNELIIVGAGLAGCWLARLLAEKGIPSHLLDQSDKVAGGASGNPAGIAKPFVTRSPCEAAAFHISAFQYLLSRLDALQLEQSSGFTDCGALQLLRRPYPASKIFLNLDAREAAGYAGMPVHSAALAFTKAGWLNPQALCHSLVKHPLITVCPSTKVNAIESVSGHRVQPQWSVKMADQQDRLSDHVVLALGHNLNSLPQTQRLPNSPARGQLSRFALRARSPVPGCVISGKHYVIPDGRTVLVGATFDRSDLSTSITENDHAVNLLGLKQTLPDIDVEENALSGYAGIRATTPDRLPLVGPVPDFGLVLDTYKDLRHGRPTARYAPLPVVPGLYVLGGLGSRGIVTAPYCAHLLANWLAGGKHFSSASLLNPARFLIRDLRRGSVRC